MSVPKGKRSLSDMQFYKNAINLRLRISEFLLRDFGIKPKVRSLQNLKDNSAIGRVCLSSDSLSLHRYRAFSETPNG